MLSAWPTNTDYINIRHVLLTHWGTLQQNVRTSTGVCCNKWHQISHSNAATTCQTWVQNVTFFKKPNPLGFLGLGFIGFLDFFIWTSSLETCLVDLAHQLSFHLHLPNFRLSKNLKIHYLLVVRSCTRFYCLFKLEAVLLLSVTKDAIS